MKKSGQIPVMTWEITRKCSPYNPNSKRCCLYLNEKLEIANWKYLAEQKSGHNIKMQTPKQIHAFQV